MRNSKILLLIFSFTISFSVVSADTPGIAERVTTFEMDSDNIYASVYNVFIEGVLRVYDRQTGEILQELDVGIDILSNIELYGDRLYTFGFDSNISIYSTEPELSFTKGVQTSDEFASITSSWVDEDYIYTYDTQEEAKVWDKDDLSLVKELEEVNGSRFIFSSEGNKFYGASSEGILSIWDKEDWSVINSVQINSTSDGNLTFLQTFYMDDDFLYTVSNDGRWTENSLVKIWNKTDLTLYHSFTVDEIINLLESDSERLYALLNRGGMVLMYNKPEFEPENSLVYNPYEILSHMLLFDDALYVSSLNGTIKIWNMDDLSLISNIGEPLDTELPTSYVEGTDINSLPLLAAIVILLVLNIMLPEKYMKKLKSRFISVSINDILQITLLVGVILLAIGVIRPTMVSKMYSPLTEPSRYFDVFVRKGIVSYYWFLLWPVVGYWLFRKKGRKMASASSLAFCLAAYLLFIFIP